MTLKQIVIQGNNLDLLPNLPDTSIDAIVTDPPYGLAFMGKAWDKTLPDPRTWTECLRVLKPGGHAVIFGAPRLYHRLACAVEDAGFEVRDVLMWMFGSGFPKSLDVSKATGDDRFKGIGTALKPAYEPILLVRKPLTGTVAHNVLAHGTGGINVDACRVATSDTYSYPHGAGGSSFGVGAGVDGSRTDTPEMHAAGRWPANVILDEEAGALLGEQSRFFYCPKASRSEREAGLDAFPARVVDESREDGSAGRENPRAGAGRKGGGRRNPHPTVKPLDLMAWCVKLITPPEGVVLDPFAGSGSTLAACAREDVRAIGFELDPDYVTIANARIAHWRKQK